MSDLVRLPNGRMGTLMLWSKGKPVPGYPAEQHVVLVAPYEPYACYEDIAEFVHQDGPPRPPPTDEERAMVGLEFYEHRQLGPIAADEPLTVEVPRAD